MVAVPYFCVGAGLYTPGFLNRAVSGVAGNKNFARKNTHMGREGIVTCVCDCMHCVMIFVLAFWSPFLDTRNNSKARSLRLTCCL